MTPNFNSRLWISFSIIVGSIIVASLVLYFLSGSMAATAAKIIRDKTVINEDTGSLAIFSALKEQASQATTYQAAMDQVLPNQDGLLDFGQWVNRFAVADQVSASISFQNNIQLPAGTTPGEAGFSLSASGSLTNLSAFTNSIQAQASGFLLQITSFNLVDQGSGNYQLTGQGELFFRS